MENEKPELVEIDCQIAQEREKAIAITDGTEEDDPRAGGKRLKWYWLPKSQITILPHGEGRFLVSIPAWLAKEKGFV